VCGTFHALAFAPTEHHSDVLNSLFRNSLVIWSGTHPYIQGVGDNLFTARRDQTKGVRDMNKTKMALVAALILGSTSMSFAESAIQRTPHHGRALQSREVALPQAAPVTGAEEQWMDRASQSFSGGGY
jgi:hypothetical protein